MALLGAFAFASYLDTELATIYKLPVWIQDLSARSPRNFGPDQKPNCSASEVWGEQVKPLDL